MLAGLVGTVSAQRNNDLYFVPKKKAAVATTPQQRTTTASTSSTRTVGTPSSTASTREVPVEERHYVDADEVTVSEPLVMDEDTYNRRGYSASRVESSMDEDGNYVQTAYVDGLALRLTTVDGDTLYCPIDTLSLTGDDEGWVYGFNGDADDYEYAMRLVRFRNPRYAIPVSSPLYWDIVYGGGLWPSWDWNIYDDGLYAYVFPSSYNWDYWNWRYMSPCLWWLVWWLVRWLGVPSLWLVRPLV